MSEYLFVSYSRADWHYVELIVAEIRRCGISTWVDIENILPGDRWKQAVNEAIKASSAIMFCISPLCLESGRTITELRKALGLGKIVIPVMVERVDYDNLPEELRDRQVIEVWQEPPTSGATRVSLSIAQKLKPGFGLEDRKTPQLVATNLILNIGDANATCVRHWLEECKVEPMDKIVERKIRLIEDLALVERWIADATTIHVVVGENVSPEVCAFFLGYVNAVVGSSSMCLFISKSDPLAEAIGAALHVRFRRLDEFSLWGANGVNMLSSETGGAHG